MNSFSEQSRIENIRRWLDSVDLTNADILAVERDIQAALYRSQNANRWEYSPIAPYAEPFNLEELVGSMFKDSQRELSFQAKRTDNLYSWLNETNNMLKAEAEAAEALVVKASDAIRDISFVTQDRNFQFYWVGDSFNTKNIVGDQSTVLVDTDYGEITLPPQTLTPVNGILPIVNPTETKGLPGCNLLVLDLPTTIQSNQELSPTLEAADTTNLGNAFDQDPSTWFEIERNFVTPKQRVVRVGRSWKTDSNGTLEDVKKITKDYDWKVLVQWPNTNVILSGDDGKGIRIAEFREVEKSNITSLSQTISTVDGSTDYDVRLVMDLNFQSPQVASILKINPMIRPGQGEVKVESVVLFTGGVEIPIAKDVEVGLANRSITQLGREILRRTGSQSVGAIYSIPTNRPIDRIRIVLRSKPYKAPNGLAHAFREEHIEKKTTSKFLFVSSTSRKKYWERKPIDETTPTLSSSYSSPKLFGSTTPLLDLLALAGLLQPQPQYVKITGQTVGGQVVGSVQQVQALTNPGFTNAIGGSVGKALGGVGKALGQVAPIIGGIVAIDGLIKSAFGSSTRKKTLEKRSGYDVFEGYRAGIALRDIEVSQVVYSPEAVFYSTRLQFNGRVSKVGLIVEEIVPEEWGVGDWINYSISADGVNWVNLPKLTDVSLDKAAEFDTPTDSVFLRAVLKGNASDPYRSPRIKNIVLQGVPA